MNTTDKQIELLKLCIEKGLTFNYSANVEKVEIQKYDLKAQEFDFYEWIYVDGRNAVQLLEGLIKKVQNYKTPVLA